MGWMYLRAVVPNENVKDNGSLRLVEAYEHLLRRKLCYNLSWYVFFYRSETIYILLLFTTAQYFLRHIHCPSQEASKDAKLM